jgi:hypothetical protein
MMRKGGAQVYRMKGLYLPNPLPILQFVGHFALERSAL